MEYFAEKEMDGVTIQESKFDLQYGGQGKIAVLMYTGDRNPIQVLNEAVAQYVGYEQAFQFIDINMDSPGIRVFMSDLNAMTQHKFDPTIHHLKD
jgi:hypothetical protein